MPPLFACNNSKSELVIVLYLLVSRATTVMDSWFFDASKYDQLSPEI